MIGLISHPDEPVSARLRDTFDAVGRVVPMHRVETIRALEKLSILVVVESTVDRDRAALIGRRVAASQRRPRVVWFTPLEPTTVPHLPLLQVDRLIDMAWATNGLFARLARAHTGVGSRDGALQALRHRNDVAGQPRLLLSYLIARVPPARTIDEIARDFGVSVSTPRKAWDRTGIPGMSLKVFLNWLQLADLQTMLRVRPGVDRAARLYGLSPRTLQRISERLLHVAPSELASLGVEAWDYVRDLVVSPQRKMGGGGE